MDRDKPMKPELTKEEQFLLREIAESRRYPVVCFELRSSREAALRSTALRNVHMETGRETMEEVKSTAALLEQLEKKVDKHNTVIERTFKLEEAQAVMQEQIKVANHRIEDLEREE